MARHADVNLSRFGAFSNLLVVLGDFEHRFLRAAVSRASLARAAQCSGVPYRVGIAENSAQILAELWRA